ncbi:MAG: CusA/CzcA family heavy metal efflux RND transporter [Muribaculaceae bacterium]|nr:CusA/CzcA family heavy metal efflux RND transporter [Muribaculaceae bacterium]
MLNRIIRASLNQRVMVLILSGLVLILGMVLLLRTDVDIFPDLNAPTVVVMTEAPGYAPEEVEKLVTFPVETAVNGATDVRRVRSSSATGFSVVWVEFEWGTDTYRARQIVSEKLATIADKLPPGVKSPTLGPQSSILGEMMIIGLTADTTSLLDLRTYADRVIAPRLLSVGGVAQVSVIGGDVKEYQIQLDPERMRFHNVGIDEVIEAVDGMNNNTSGGVMYDYGNEYLIKADVSTTDPELLSQAVVRSDDNGIVKLADIATITIAAQSPRLGLASERGKPAVLITVTKQPATGTIALTERIEETLASMKTNLPADVNISTDIFKQADFIDNSIGNLQRSLFEGAIMVIIVLFFFLMNLRTTLISLIALPLSIIVTVIVLHIMGMTINTMSLGGIAIAIGSLVDDAIVDVENVYKRLRANRMLPPEQRQSTIKVVYEASREVRMPIFNSSLIIIASFLPLFFLSGLEGRMLIPLGISFIVALLASTVVALTVTPVLCSYLLGSSKDDNKELSKESWVSRTLGRLYTKSLKWSLNHRKIWLAVVIVLFIGSTALLFTLGRSFLPAFNEGSLTINVSTLPGISLDESDAIGRKAEEIILSMPEVKTVARKTGRAELDEHSLGVNVSEIEAPYTLQGRSRGEMVKELREKLTQLPGTNIEIGQPISHRIDAMLSGTEAQIAIKLFGDDLNQLYRLGSQIKELASTVDGVVDVNLEQQTGRPQLDIRPRREMMARYGVTMPQLTRFIEVMLAGQPVSAVYIDGLPYDLTLKVAPSQRSTIEDIGKLMIETNNGKVPLSEVAEVVSTTGPNTINRENVSRRIVISANIEGNDLRGTVNAIRDLIDQQVKLPEGYYLQYSGQFESEAAASSTLAWTSIGALLIILMLLYQEFHNVKQPLIILVNMPLAMIGGVLMLVATGAELNIPAIIGFISLLGITTRNGMLLMSRYNKLKAEGMPLLQRISQGSHDRLNPIIMTALTSALALIPLALRGGEPGNEIQSPLAVVILGGLISSTILNVFVVPILYYLSCRKELKH